jgi:crotonobetainyl-CoA:carnitine CoA-transferase CaiB-like acyl-CoA transferase
VTERQAAAHDAEASPLHSVRVLDLTDGKAELTARLLGDLGADVVRIEAPVGSQARRRAPLHRGTSLYDLARNNNKRSVVLDLAAGADRDLLWRLVDTAEIVVEDRAPGELDALGVGPRAMLDRRPDLVVVSVTDFGQTGPYRDWVATEQVHLAMAGVLSRSGLPGRVPLLPPGSLATDCAATSAAWSALLAYWNALDSGLGDHVDLSLYEATAQVVDPLFGMGGSATAARGAEEGPRGRPDARHLYPIFPCADGHVRLCVLAARQWQGLFRWLGEPSELADPALADLRTRQRSSDLIFPVVRAFFATRNRAQIIAEAQQFGVPAAGLLLPGEVLASEQLAARGALVAAQVADGATAQLVNGALEVDGVRAGIRRSAPALGEHTAEVLAELEDSPQARRHRVVPGVTARRRPLEGLRVLDLGVIVVGAETGRLLADMGADVIKVENPQFVDGSRAGAGIDTMTIAFAWGHRNKTGLGLNLRDERGVDVFLALAAKADVVLSNFKPGTLESLGLGADRLAAANPGLVMLDSSAYGPSGPWSRRMGYGPLVRSETAVSTLWRYPDIPESFSDAATVYPDHVAARLGALAVLALLIGRRRTGRGGTVSIAQSEVILDHFGPQFAAESLNQGAMTAVGNALPGDAPRGVFPCAGDDEWLVITIRGDDDWQRLSALLGPPELASDTRYMSASGRVTHRAVIDELVTGWTTERSPREAMEELQSRGVPAGMMQRVADLRDDPQLSDRGFLRTLSHPQLARPALCENAPAVFGRIADPECRPAPMMGEQTREICARLLDMSDAEVDDFVEAGVLVAPGKGDRD